MNRTIQSIGMAGLLGVVAGATGCGGLFDVESPGLIADADLHTPAAVPGLVAGMSNRMSAAIGRAGDGNSMVIFSALVSGELYHGGSYAWDNIPGGFVTPDDGYMGGAWNAAQEARWVAEAGLRLMATDSVLGAAFGSNAYVARAYLFAALANRTLGENFCTAVVDSSLPDGSEVPTGALSSQVYFDRAMGQADSAIAVGIAAGGTTAPTYVKAAYGVRASLKAWAGDWAGAVADAQQVTPANFSYTAFMQQPDPQNELWDESYNRREYTVWSTFMSSDSMAQLENMNGPAWQAAHLNDPRAKWEILAQKGQDGYTLMYRENKYPTASTAVPLVKGTEMLLLRAEAALRQATPDTVLAYQLMNQARAVYTLPALATHDAATAWKDLHYERGATTWLEGRHLWDASRWYNEPASSPAHSEAMADRDQCLPVSLGEINANPNLGGYKATLVHPLKHQ